MDSYTIFAQVYDKFIQAPYDQWADYIEQIWTKFADNRPKLVLDLACGTGNMAQILGGRGYDMIGVDNSVEMLSQARQKDPETLYLLQDMREFELYGSIDAIVCICDSLNYILEYDELMQVFLLCHYYLNPDGILIFDVNTEYKYNEILADNNFSQTDENAAYIWENYYDKGERLNEFATTFFIKQKGGLFARHEELHIQKAHSIQEIKNALITANLEILAEFDELTFNPPNPQSERIFFVAKKSIV